MSKPLERVWTENPPWINKPKYKVGDIVFPFVIHEKHSLSHFKKDAIMQLAKAKVIGYMYKKLDTWIHGDIPPQPLYLIEILEIYVDPFHVLKLGGAPITFHQKWIEDGDKAYRLFFGKSPRREEFVFR